MDHANTANPLGDSHGAANAGLSRRQLGIAAAWAAPIIAVVATAPLASASVQDEGTILRIDSATSLTGNTPSGTPISGSAGGDFLITNVGGPWQAAPVTAFYSLTGPIAPTDLLYEGDPIETDDEIVIGGRTWKVLYFGPTTGGVLAVLELLLPIDIPAGPSTEFAVAPTFTFATVSTANANQFNRIQWQLEMGAVAVGGNPAVSISDIAGKSIPAA